MPASSLDILPVEGKAMTRRFLAVPDKVYADDPHWRSQLGFERAAHLNPNKNPGAASLENRQLFIAVQDGRDVGRIAAFINPAHNAHSSSNDGFFGFFDCIAEPQIGKALLERAESWLSDRGVNKAIGPAQWSVNEECGLLIDGFETPPVVMMPHGRPAYQEMIEGQGFLKATDMLAFQAELAAGYPRPKMTQAMVRSAARNKDIVIRPMRPSKFMEDVNIVMGIFNDAWSENWGFVPFSDKQITHMAKEIKPIMFKEGMWVGEYKGEPIAYIWMIPDLNEAIRDLGGSILPFGWAKLLWRLKVSGVKQARIPLMGLRKEYHNTRTGLSIVASLCETVFDAARQKGFTHCELSWILEDNPGMIAICEQASAKAYKTYRMYEKNL
ncbi:hypothetical protein [Hellea balneolensis]|uniref:hypothetical protein n=1 Tax=Hellea balneolensis TaxID=287478 RepID=UPI0012B7E546|nr:hypothetical protein [Hellea balneolensis]